MKAINYTALSLNLKKWLDTVVDDVERSLLSEKTKGIWF